MDVVTQDPAVAPAVARPRKAGGRAALKKSAVTKQRIVEAAALQCAEKGYSLTKLGEIAEAAGIHISALYYHFDTKEDLFSEVVAMLAEQAAASFHEALRLLPADATPYDRLVTAIYAHLRSILRTDAFGQATLRIVQQGPMEVRARAYEITRRESETFRELIAAAAASGAIKPDVDLTMARMILFGAMNWAVEWFRAGPRSVDDLAEEIVKVMFGGLAAAPGGKS